MSQTDWRGGGTPKGPPMCKRQKKKKNQQHTYTEGKQLHKVKIHKITAPKESLPVTFMGASILGGRQPRYLSVP